MGVLLPLEVCERAERLAKWHGICAAAEIVGISRTSVWRLRKRGWKACNHADQRRPMPSDFAIQSRHMTHDELRAHYQASSQCITRWRRELRR